MYTSYKSFNNYKEKCRDCSIGKTYNRVVLSDGNTINPKVLIIGEAPGKDEVEIGRPFVGKAGKLLRGTLNKYGYGDTNSCITNILPCRPENNKFPKDKELVNYCVNNWLSEEIHITNPQFILLIGSTPLYYLTGKKGITSYRGKLQVYQDRESGNEYSCMPVYHPSYVLRKMYMQAGKQIMADFENDIKELAKMGGFYADK